MLDESWEKFRSGMYEIRILLQAADNAQISPTDKMLVTEQQVYIRATIILLSSHVEGFFKELPNEYSEKISDKSWNVQPKGTQRYIALQILHHLQAEIQRAENCQDEDKREKIKRSVILASRWFTRPSRLSEYEHMPKLSGFYKHKGSRPLEDFLLDYRYDQEKFFSWLSRKHFDRSKFWTVIEGLVNARNEIAHGNAQSSLTLAEVRSYVAVCILLIRQVRVYVSQ